MQTAVEYLIEQLQAPCRGIPSHIIEQAKEIERKQIIDAYMDRMDITDKEVVAKIIGEEYYQKTFKK